MITFFSFSGRPVSNIFIAPSVTPRRSSSGFNNPAIRLYKFNSDTGQVKWINKLETLQMKTSTQIFHWFSDIPWNNLAYLLWIKHYITMFKSHTNVLSVS